MPTAKRSRILTWLKWIGLGLLALVVLALAGGAAFEAAARHHARSAYPPRGQLVDIGGRRIHVDCRGRGAPTVVFESGLDYGGSLAWSKVHDQIATVTRACAYDRAGIMWSDRKPGVHDADGAADDLHAALKGAGEKGPVVLVAHSLGGPLVMDFTRKYGDQVAGVVFVDASHADQLTRMKAAGISLPEVPPTLKALVGVTWTGWTRIPGVAQGVPNMPPAAVEPMKAYMSVSAPAALKEQDAIETIFAQGGKLRTLGDRPLIVLTATKPLPPEILAEAKITRADEAKLRTVWVALHDDEASWSTHSRHQLVPDSTHYIQFERPDVVIAAVEEVVADVRGQPAPPAAANQ